MFQPQTKDCFDIIGINSGMSMDGIDLAHIQIRGTFPKLDIKLVNSTSTLYSNAVKNRLLALRNASLQNPLKEISEINVVLAECFASAVNGYLENSHVKSSAIDLIAAHGQAVYHHMGDSQHKACTLQIGSGSVLAELTGIPAATQFRSRDMVLGGNGAPLVPILDYVLFHDRGPIALNNLGSISNLAVISQNLSDVVAFDTGPANLPIDFVLQTRLGDPQAIDKDGKYSQSGNVIDSLLRDLLALPFFQLPPPKAAGYGEFGPDVLGPIFDKYQSETINDLVRTAVEFSAITIADAYKKWILPNHALKSIHFAGGGAHNLTLMKRISDHLPSEKISTFEQAGFPHQWIDAKEAIMYGLLGYLLINKIPANVPGATGAKRQCLLGELSLASSP